MFHETPNDECSKCNSNNSELFSNRTHHGIRCKTCGHEKSTMHTPDNIKTYSWSHDGKARKF